MLTLDISVDLGPGALPAEVEALVRAIRVATDVGLASERSRVRRIAAEQMKYPTDAELRDVLERLPPGDETGPQYRARRHLDARQRFAEDVGDFPPRLWDYWYRMRGVSSERVSYLAGTGFERALQSNPVPWIGGAALGLDALDPVLYQALVAERVTRLSPDLIFVREMRYSNPFGEVVAGVGAAEKAVKTTAGVVETAATLGSRRKISKAEAQIAKETIEDRIEESRLSVELRREELRRARIENAMAEEELLSKRIQNAQALESMSPRRRQQALVDHFTASGQLDEADAIATADPADAAALAQFALRPPELTEEYVPDSDEDG